MDAARTASPKSTTLPHAADPPSTDLPRWREEIQRATEAQLARAFEERRAATIALGATSPEDGELLAAIASLTLRGGKRLRPLLLVASFRAVSPDAIWTRTLGACAALELFQTYLLVHDDWMDGDEQRRGGPSVHAYFRERTGDAHLGSVLAILSGDFASAMAWELFVECAQASGPSGPAAIKTFGRIHHEAVLGQAMDVRGARDVAAMQRLKTGGYTVTGPLEIGALLAGGSPAALAALGRFGAPLGEAFQIKDDLLGVFGDPARTGKPIGSDLRSGRRNALVRECERLLAAEERAALEQVLGREDASDVEVAEIVRTLERAGIRARLEEKLAGLLATALGELERGPFADPGRAMLRDLAHAIVHRDR
jgi:geranylgeranyl diphosphate synthase type I